MPSADIHTAAHQDLPRSCRVVVWTVMTTCLLAACGGGDLVLPENGGPAAIRVVDGDGQSGSVGRPLTSPIIVEVTDAKGEPVQGTSVEFAFISAGAGSEIVPSTATTDAAGHAQAHVLLGSKTGLQIGEARVALDGATPLKTSFSALAISDSSGNHSPTADFDSHCEGLTCQFTDASTDSDGTLTGWTWTFGDGNTATEREPVHSYSGPGTYTVTLSVTDDDGSSDESSTQVTASAPSIPPANDSPHAEFELSCQQLRCTFTDRSSDGDGSIVGRQWDFGDGARSSEQNPSHSYGTAGGYEVRLTVTDNDGAADTRTHTAQPEAPALPPPPPQANKPPDAEFEVHCSVLTCTFIDTSKDDDGSIVSWQWRFGDGATSSERNPSHSYGTEGRYEVLLTVTDNDGAADAKIRTAEPQAPAPPPPPPEPNKPPDAEFEVHCSGLTCTFTDKSKDDDGIIVSWEWSFGDGANSNEQNPVHTYAERGRYNVVLTVRDNAGATDTKDRRADVKD